MAEVKDIVGNVIGESEKVLNRALDNPYISTGIKIFLGLYAAFAAPKLPKSLANLLDNTLVRVGFAFCIVFMATRDPSIAILLAVAFIVTLQTANKMRLYDTSMAVSGPHPNTSWLPSAKGSDYVNQEGQDVPSDLSLGGVVDSGVDFVQDVVDTGVDMVSNVVDTGVGIARDVVGAGADVVRDVANVGQEGLYNTGSNIVHDVVGAGSHLLGDVAGAGRHLSSDLGDLTGNIHQEATARASNPSDSLLQVVEGLEGAYIPTAVQNSQAVQQEAMAPQGEFTSSQQFQDAQNNKISGANQMSCVQTWNNTNCIQGLQSNAPNGTSGNGLLGTPSHYSKF